MKVRCGYRSNISDHTQFRGKTGLKLPTTEESKTLLFSSHWLLVHSLLLQKSTSDLFVKFKCKLTARSPTDSHMTASTVASWPSPSCIFGVSTLGQQGGIWEDIGIGSNDNLRKVVVAPRQSQGNHAPKLTYCIQLAAPVAKCSSWNLLGRLLITFISSVCCQS